MVWRLKKENGDTGNYLLDLLHSKNLPFFPFLTFVSRKYFVRMMLLRLHYEQNEMLIEVRLSAFDKLTPS